ncbi:MAG: lysophospholipid acyltransferase family protein [Halieaceae bacterium]|jgi:Kdo2-lipid IVA lauroyltransferase/acyltransferase|nr:lysophospholipid acyltransferase family protein [Halieaceae bacterium]
MIELLLLRSSIFFLRLLPLNALRWIGSAAGDLAYRLNTRMARTARTNIALCLPGKNHEARELLVRRCLQETGKAATETGITWGWPLSRAAELITEVQNEQLFDDAIEAGKGILIILLHHGNWEIINHYLYRRKTPFAAIYKPPKGQQLDRWITESRKKSGLSLYPAGREGAEILKAVVKEGGIVLYAPDQEPGTKSGIFAPLFGVEALTGTFTHNLLQHSPESIAICTYVLRTEDGFKVVFEAMDEQLYSADPREAATALNRSIEPCILDHTEQYQWAYKRFKKSPDRKKDIYS